MKRDFSIRGSSPQNQFYWALNGKKSLRGAKQIKNDFLTKLLNRINFYILMELKKQSNKVSEKICDRIEIALPFTFFSFRTLSTST